MFKTFLQKLQSDRYITLETTPSHSSTIQPIIETIDKLDIITKIDGFTTTDNPLAKLKYNSILAAIKFQDYFKKPVIATMSMRDRNIIALQSDMLGANDFDIRTFLMLTGDPAKMSDQPNAKGVFEGNSLKLLQIAKFFNAGIDYSGKKIDNRPKEIYPFAVSNSFAKNFKVIERGIYKKIDNGAVGIITQPIYSLENAKKLLEIFENVRNSFKDTRANSKLIFGIFPITKLKTAQFLRSHVPGIEVPSFWEDALFKANQIGEEEEKKVGLEMSKNLFKELMKINPRVHIMTANKFNIAKEILES